MLLPDKCQCPAYPRSFLQRSVCCLFGPYPTELIPGTVLGRITLGDAQRTVWLRIEPRLHARQAPYTLYYLSGPQKESLTDGVFQENPDFSLLPKINLKTVIMHWLRDLNLSFVFVFPSFGQIIQTLSLPWLSPSLLSVVWSLLCASFISCTKWQRWIFLGKSRSWHCPSIYYKMIWLIITLYPRSLAQGWTLCSVLRLGQGNVIEHQEQRSKKHTIRIPVQRGRLKCVTSSA